VIVVLADAGIEAERELIYAALVATLGQTDVVLMWQDSSGRTRFIAPVQQHRFFEAMRYDQLLAQANSTVTLTRP
jgi:hypothetical protein